MELVCLCGPLSLRPPRKRVCATATSWQAPKTADTMGMSAKQRLRTLVLLHCIIVHKAHGVWRDSYRKGKPVRYFSVSWFHGDYLLELWGGWNCQ